jgi:hypothetical protein
VDPALEAIDQTPPSVTANDVEFRRPTLNEPTFTETVGCQESITSCDGSPHRVSVRIYSAQDDQTPAEQIGYLLEIVEGEAPSDFLVVFATEEERRVWRDPATQPIRLPDHTIRFNASSDPDNPERVEFVLKITPVDLAGNVGEPVLVRVTDPDYPEGCQSVGARSNLPPLLAALALLLAQRAWRLRRRAGGGWRA